PFGEAARQCGDEEGQERQLGIGAAVAVHHLPRLLERGGVIFLDQGEVLNAAVRFGHVLGDLAAEADDLDHFVLARRRGAAGHAAAVVEQISVEVGGADAVAGGLHLRQIDAEVACPGASGGGGGGV